jgi:hypothetical protein
VEGQSPRHKFRKIDVNDRTDRHLWNYWDFRFTGTQSRMRAVKKSYNWCFFHRLAQKAYSIVLNPSVNRGPIQRFPELPVQSELFQTNQSEPNLKRISSSQSDWFRCRRIPEPPSVLKNGNNGVIKMPFLVKVLLENQINHRQSGRSSSHPWPVRWLNGQ